MWIITFGSGSQRQYAAERHMEQFCRALRMNGTKFTVIWGKP